MSESALHFAHPGWLPLLLMPLLVLLWLRLSATREEPIRYRAYADAHLLPLLLGHRRQRSGRGRWRRLLAWSALWSLLVIAMAAPRWGFEDLPLYRPGSDLVVLLDLSASMEVGDVAPSRLARARQEIEDLIAANRYARIGLIAFATVAHVVTPLTEDGGAIRLQLPAISTDLVQLKGSRLSEALMRAEQMFAGQPRESSRHLLLITDGDFGDDTGGETASRLAAEGIHLHILGIGTEQGGPVTTPQGMPIYHAGGRPVISRLDEQGLKTLAELGGGLYLRADFRDDDTAEILARVGSDARAEAVGEQSARVWNERFFWPLGLAMVVLLPLFRGRRRVREWGS